MFCLEYINWMRKNYHEQNYHAISRAKDTDKIQIVRPEDNTKWLMLRASSENERKINEHQTF
jgi:hypothetical protein